MKRAALTKERVAAWLERRFYLRLHMFFILGGTYLAGLLATKLLLLAGLNVLWLRYALAVCAAYGVFLSLIRLWLIYINVYHSDSLDLTADGIDFAGRFWSTDIPVIEGGRFGGGGATGSWGDASQAVAAPKASGGGGGLKGCGIDGGDEGCAVVLLIVLVFSLVVIAIYMIYTAPVLLSEAAFEAALAAALARRAKKIERRGWVDTVWRATVWPFVAVLLVSAALGWFAQHHCPEAKKLRDVWECPSKRGV
ncbi:MAG TPA: hypothetical protein VNA69_22585 [Thermoanaerobaculia bacterium]|nr:hypothetical protein [Thermoanaerobaculia bacterium]